MNPAERLVELESALDALRRAAAGAAVIVEGRKDVLALEALGVGGVHLLIHTGKTLEARSDEIAADHAGVGWPRVVLLTDWDRTGGRLADRLQKALSARVPLDLECRRRLARASHASCVEEVPADLAALRASLEPGGRIG